MGVDFHASAVIGCEVTGKTTKTETYQPCSHELITSRAKFCPECGGPVEATRKVDIPGLAIVYSSGLRSFFTTDREREFIGAGIGNGSHRHSDEEGAARMELPDLAQLKMKMQALLEPLGLWDEQSFGLWAVSYVSY